MRNTVHVFKTKEQNIWFDLSYEISIKIFSKKTFYSLFKASLKCGQILQMIMDYPVHLPHTKIATSFLP